MAVTFEPLIRFWCPLECRKFFIPMTFICTANCPMAANGCQMVGLCFVQMFNGRTVLFKTVQSLSSSVLIVQWLNSAVSYCLAVQWLDNAVSNSPSIVLPYIFNTKCIYFIKCHKILRVLAYSFRFKILLYWTVSNFLYPWQSPNISTPNIGCHECYAFHLSSNHRGIQYYWPFFIHRISNFLKIQKTYSAFEKTTNNVVRSLLLG